MILGALAGGAAVVPARTRAASGVGFPVTLQLFGPTQRQGALGADGYTLPQAWQFPGSALTPSTKLIRWDLGVAPVLSAVWRMSWVTHNPMQQARLVYFDDGPTNLVGIASILGTGRGQPDNQAVDVTNALNGLRALGQSKNIGFQLHGDGASPVALYESRIEITFQV